MAFKPYHRQWGLTWLGSPDFKADYLHCRASWTLNLPSNLSSPLLPWVGAHWLLFGIHYWKKIHFLHTLTRQTSCPGLGLCQGWCYGPMVYMPPSLSELSSPRHSHGWISLYSEIISNNFSSERPSPPPNLKKIHHHWASANPPRA